MYSFCVQQKCLIHPRRARHCASCPVSNGEQNRHGLCFHRNYNSVKTTLIKYVNNYTNIDSSCEGKEQGAEKKRVEKSRVTEIAHFVLKD